MIPALVKAIEESTLKLNLSFYSRPKFIKEWKKPNNIRDGLKKMEEKSNAKNMRRILSSKKLQKYNHQKGNEDSILKSGYKSMY